TIYQHYIANHPQKDIDFLIDIIRLDYPDYVDDMNYFLYNKKGSASLTLRRLMQRLKSNQEMFQE
ncbi:MAG: hypothetical protein RR063_09235, partial [Anaerovoracaceae bacterium]